MFALLPAKKGLPKMSSGCGERTTRMRCSKRRHVPLTSSRSATGMTHSPNVVTESPLKAASGSTRSVFQRTQGPAPLAVARLALASSTMPSDAPESRSVWDTRLTRFPPSQMPACRARSGVHLPAQ